MQFIIIGQDGQDPDAPQRRQDARESHLAYSNIAAKSGEQIIAAAMVGPEDQMIGSVLIVDFDSIEDVKEWLDKEAYITGDVWENVQIIPCKLPPHFEHLIKRGVH